MGPEQRSLAMQLVATGLSTAGYVTVCDGDGPGERPRPDRGLPAGCGRRAAARPGPATTCGCSATRAAPRPGAGGWAATTFTEQPGRRRPGGGLTPNFLGADPASAPLLGDGRCGRWGRRGPGPRAGALPAAGRPGARGAARPGAVGHRRRNDPSARRGCPAPALARGAVRPPSPADPRARAPGQRADHVGLLTAPPKSLPATEPSRAARAAARLLAAYTGRCRPVSPPPPGLDTVHLAWAGSLEPGRPHYYRLQARAARRVGRHPGDANHAHSVWRNPTATSASTSWQRTAPRITGCDGAQTLSASPGAHGEPRLPWAPTPSGR